MAARGQAANRLNEQRRKRKEEEERKRISDQLKDPGFYIRKMYRASRELGQRGEGNGSPGASNSSSGGVAGRSRGTGAMGTGPASQRPGNPRAALPPRVSGSGKTGGFRKATAADIGSGSAAPKLPAKKAAARKPATAKMPEKPKRPVTRGKKLGMNSPEMREYRKKLAAYRKAQEASSKKSAGGRVMMKKAAAKKAAKKKAARRP
jgi:hypothetical protein